MVEDVKIMYYNKFLSEIVSSSYRYIMILPIEATFCDATGKKTNAAISQEAVVTGQ